MLSFASNIYTTGAPIPEYSTSISIEDLSNTHSTIDTDLSFLGSVVGLSTISIFSLSGSSA